MHRFFTIAVTACAIGITSNAKAEQGSAVGTHGNFSGDVCFVESDALEIVDHARNFRGDSVTVYRVKSRENLCGPFNTKKMFGPNAMVVDEQLTTFYDNLLGFTILVRFHIECESASDGSVSLHCPTVPSTLNFYGFIGIEPPTKGMGA